jgi:tRNA wybutosine-synthesizing protein 3
MGFEKEKKEFLEKRDKSKKGYLDIKIKKLTTKLNSLDDFFTTSSCAGRILLFSLPSSNKKNEVQYLFNSHKKIQSNKINDTIKKILKIIKLKKIKNDVWFRVDGAILHVASNNIDSARKLLNAARDIGFRRSGIISLGKNRVTMELISTEKIETIVSKNGKLLVDEDYFKVLVKEGNEKLEKTWKKIDRLYNKLLK